jgi:hypothetical protein
MDEPGTCGRDDQRRSSPTEINAGYIISKTLGCDTTNSSQSHNFHTIKLISLSFHCLSIHRLRSDHHTDTQRGKSHSRMLHLTGQVKGSHQEGFPRLLWPRGGRGAGHGLKVLLVGVHTEGVLGRVEHTAEYEGKSEEGGGLVRKCVSGMKAWLVGGRTPETSAGYQREHHRLVG